MYNVFGLSIGYELHRNDSNVAYIHEEFDCLSYIVQHVQDDLLPIYLQMLVYIDPNYCCLSMRHYRTEKNFKVLQQMMSVMSQFKDIFEVVWEDIAREILFGAIVVNDVEVFDRIFDHRVAHVKDNEGNNVFAVACMMGRMDIVKKILLLGEMQEIGGPVNAKNANGMSGFGLACEHGMSTIVRFLFEHNWVLINDPNNNGETPFYVACSRGQLDVVNTFLVCKEMDSMHFDVRNIDLNTKCKHGYTPFIRCCANGHAAVVKILVSSPFIEYNAQTKFGYTGLMYACKKNHAEVVNLLLTVSDIDLFVENQFKQNAYRVATKEAREILKTCKAFKDEIEDDIKEMEAFVFVGTEEASSVFNGIWERQDDKFNGRVVYRPMDSDKDDQTLWWDAGGKSWMVTWDGTNEEGEYTAYCQQDVEDPLELTEEWNVYISGETREISGIRFQPLPQTGIDELSYPEWIFTGEQGLFRYVCEYNDRPAYKSTRGDYWLFYANEHWNVGWVGFRPKARCESDAFLPPETVDGDSNNSIVWKVWHDPRTQSEDLHGQRARWVQKSFPLRYNRWKVGDQILAFDEQHQVMSVSQIISIPDFRRYEINFAYINQTTVVLESQCAIYTKVPRFLPAEGDLELKQSVLEEIFPDWPEALLKDLAEWCCYAGLQTHGLCLFGATDYVYLETSSLKSLASTASVCVNWVNETGHDVRQLWVDFDGELREYSPIGETSQMSTYLNHPWHLKIGDETLCCYVLKEIEGDLVVTIKSDGYLDVKLSDNMT